MVHVTMLGALVSGQQELHPRRGHDCIRAGKDFAKAILKHMLALNTAYAPLNGHPPRSLSREDSTRNQVSWGRS
jgi:hypothetical protein